MRKREAGREMAEIRREQQEAVEVQGRVVTEGTEQLAGRAGDDAARTFDDGTPMAGPCLTPDCLSGGWTAPGPGGDVTTRCMSGDCSGTGWISERPDGTKTETRCRFKACFRDGWTTRSAKGLIVDVECNMSSCWRNGWAAKLPDGAVVQTRCSLRSCLREGWTAEEHGRTVTCLCRRDDCLRNGADCTSK